MGGTVHLLQKKGATLLMGLAVFVSIVSFVFPSTAYAFCTINRAGEEVCTTDNGDGTITTEVLDGPRAGQEQTVSAPPDVGNILKDGLLAVVLAPVAALAFAILSIASFLLYIAGAIFDWGVGILIFDFGRYFGNSEGMLIAWGILRDIGNIVLLFGFIFIGLQTILNLHHFSVGKTLPRLIIFAVLLNFSLFASETIIDTSNLFAAKIYEQSSGESVNTDTNVAVTTNGQIQGNLASRIMYAAGLGGIWQVQGENNGFNLVSSAVTDPIGNTLRYIGLALLVTVAAVVILAGGILLISRGITLAFLMVVSPLGFAGMAIPQFEDMAKKWWKKLIDQAMFAPVFLLLIFVGLKLTEGLGAIGGDGNLANAISSKNVIDTGPLMLFALVIGFMIAALMAAKQFGIMGSDFAIKTAGGAVYGTMGFIGRRTLGAGSNMVANRIKRSRFGTTLVGKTLAGVATKGASSSFDFRGTGIPKATGIDLGQTSKVGKEGRAGELKNAAEKASKYAESLKKARKSQDTEFKQTSTDLQRKADIARAQADVEGKKKTPNADKVKNLTDLASSLEDKKAENDAKHEFVKRNRLNQDDRTLLSYYARAGKSDQMEREGEERAKGAADDAARSFDNASTRLASAEGRLTAATENLAKVQSRPPADTADEDTKQRYADELHDAEEGLRLAQQEKAMRNTEREKAEQEAKDIKAKYDAQVKARKERGEKVSTEMLDAKYAMEQYARKLSETAGTIVGQALDPAKLKAGAAGIRGEAGKDPKFAAFEHLMHEMGGHGDDHGEKHEEKPHAPAKPAAGGGGGAAHPPADHH